MYCASCDSPLTDSEISALGTRRGVPKHYCDTCSRDYRRWSNIRIRYKITKEQYNEIVESQDGKCVLCHEDIGPKSVIDHCHSSGVVRGILCNNCNALVGFSKESIEVLNRTIEYLKRWKEKAE